MMIAKKRSTISRVSSSEGNIKALKNHVVQYRLFESGFDVGAMSYDEVINVLVDYISMRIMSSYNFRIWGVSFEVSGRLCFYLGEVSRYLRGELSEEEMDFYCNENIRNRRDGNFAGKELALMGIVQYVLFNRVRSGVEREGADYYIGFVFADIEGLDEDASVDFREFIEIHPLMEKYRIHN